LICKLAAEPVAPPTVEKKEQERITGALTQYRVVKRILSSRKIRESSRHVFPGRAARERHITIDINSSIQVSNSCQT